MVLEATTDAGSPRIVLHNLKLNTRIHVIGVAHCSQRSNNDVAHSIRTIRPSVVLLELCQERRSIFSRSWPPEDDWRTLAASTHGLEQVVGCREGFSCGAMVLLCDRRLSVTRGRMLDGLIDTLLDPQSWPSAVTQMREWHTGEEREEGQKMTRKLIEGLVDRTDDLPAELRSTGWLKALREERDLWLAHSCWHASCAMKPNTSAVAVFGAAHLKGVQKYFDECADHAVCDRVDCRHPQIEALDTAPPISKPLGLAAGLLALGTSSLVVATSSLAIRYVVVKKLTARGGRIGKFAKWGNRGALGFAACLTSYGAYCAVDNYHSVRAVQQRVRKHYDQSHQS